MKKILIFIILFFSIWCSNWNDLTNETKSIELYIDNEIKKERLISELKNAECNNIIVNSIDIKIDNSLYNEDYLNTILKYYNWNYFSLVIENVDNYEIPFLTLSNIESFKNINNQSYLYYWYNIITKYEEQIWYINDMNKIDLEKYNSIISKYKKLKEENFNQLNWIIENSWIKTDRFLLYWYSIRIK